jgi:hypothetical protein
VLYHRFTGRRDDVAEIEVVLREQSLAFQVVRQRESVIERQAQHVGGVLQRSLSVRGPARRLFRVVENRKSARASSVMARILAERNAAELRYVLSAGNMYRHLHSTRRVSPRRPTGALDGCYRRRAMPPKPFPVPDPDATITDAQEARKCLSEFHAFAAAHDPCASPATLPTTTPRRCCPG